jgi:hypothetical protein
MVLKDSGEMQKRGLSLRKQYFHLYLKEIEFRFNHRQENVFQGTYKHSSKNCSKCLGITLINNIRQQRTLKMMAIADNRHFGYQLQ